MLEFFKKLFGFGKKKHNLNDANSLYQIETPVQNVETVLEGVESTPVTSEEVKKSKPRRRYSQKSNKSGEKKEVAKVVVKKETPKKKESNKTSTEKVSKPRKPKTNK